MTAAYLEISAWLILYVLLLPKNVLLLPRPEACNFVKKRLKQRCFPAKFSKFLGTPILKIICEWLLLNQRFNNRKMN